LDGRESFYESFLRLDVSSLVPMNQKITVEELSRRLEADPQLQLIDVRSAGEYAAGHVPRALNLPLEQVESRIEDLHHGPVAILCHSGHRAQMACEILTAHHSNLLVVEGGTAAWAAAGKPITGPIGSRWSLERQVRLVAGMLTLIGTLASVFISPGWVYLAMFVGAGLTFAGATNICGMAVVLAKLPWNKARATTAPMGEVSA
jgi:rhodanese-related sulfurtransferase